MFGIADVAVVVATGEGAGAGGAVAQPVAKIMDPPTTNVRCQAVELIMRIIGI